MEHGKKPILADIPMQSDEWTIDISATTGSLKDENNTIGVMHIAEDGFDIFDEFEPPMMSGHVSLRIDNRIERLRLTYTQLTFVSLQRKDSSGTFSL